MADEIIDDVLGVIGDASAGIVFVDGDDVAMDGAAVNRAEFVFKKHDDPPPFKRTCGGQKV